MKDQILADSKELFFKYGVKSVTMDDIAKELGMSKKTLYQYVKNKEELIHLIIERHIELKRALMNKVNENSKDAIDEMFGFINNVIETLGKLPTTTIYDLQKYYSKSWKLVLEFNEDFLYKFIKQNLERGVKEKLYRPELDLNVIARLYVVGGLTVTNESVFPSNEHNKDEVFSTFIIYHINGIATEKGAKKLNKYLEQVAKKKLSKTEK